MTPLQGLCALFHSHGVSEVDLQTVAALVRLRIHPSKAAWLEAEMPTQETRRWQLSHNALVKAGARGVALREQLLLQLLTGMTGSEATARLLLQQITQRFGLN